MAADLSSDGHDHDDDLVASINVTPFVDVVLVLLVVLMVASTQIVRAAITVDLPRAQSGGELTRPTINLVLTADRGLLLDGRSATLTGLRQTIATRRRVQPRLQVAIAADRTVRYHRVIALVDTVKQAGVESFALNIDPRVRATAQSPK